MAFASLARLLLVLQFLAGTATVHAQIPAQHSPPPNYDTRDSAVQFTSPAPAPDSPLTLWYRHPAKQWVEALPIGNGRLGAMVFGGINREILQLNLDTLRLTATCRTSTRSIPGTTSASSKPPNSQLPRRRA